LKGFTSTLATIWRLAIPYFRSNDRWPGRFLLAAVIAIELSQVAITVRLNQWHNEFYNALQERDWSAFIHQLLIFGALAGTSILLAVYQLYLRQWLQIRWRSWMTRHYLDRWLTGANHYRMQLLGDAADNPDQRIAEDIQLFIDRALIIGIGLLSSIVTLFSFVVILWMLSDAAPLILFGTTLAIPGYLVWAALLYAVIGTVVTHFVGRPLVALNFQQQHYEANFRFNLVRVRENSEQIALLRGEAAESGRLLDRFGKIVTNWLAIMRRTKRLTFLTAGYGQISDVFPLIVISPAYFAGAVQLGGLMQTADAFSSVQGALSFFITAYRQLAEWGAVIERLDGFDAAAANARAVAVTSPVVNVYTRDEKGAVEIDDLAVRLPNNAPLLATDNIAIGTSDRMLVTGPSGSGKSTLFRAIAGIWPFGSGKVSIPADAKVMVLPQRPYFPVASLGSAITYPAEPGTFDVRQIADVLGAVGLAGMAARLAEEAHWNRMLSLGEQQRLGIVRAILHAPDFLFLDEATASLDEAAEAAVYRLLQERLPRATIVSIGHRSTLGVFHRRRLVLVADGSGYRASEAALEPAAS
jgi:putative ATP-binding cassette transporter